MNRAQGLLGLAFVFCIVGAGFAAAQLFGMALDGAQGFPAAVTGATAFTADYLMAKLGVVPGILLIGMAVSATTLVALGRRGPRTRVNNLAGAVLAVGAFGLATAGIPDIAGYRLSPEAARSPDVLASHALSCRKDFQDAQRGPVGPRNGYRMLECKPVLTQDAIDRYCGEAVAHGNEFRDGNEQAACHAEAPRLAGHPIAGPLTDRKVAEIQRFWSQDKRRTFGG